MKITPQEKRQGTSSPSMGDPRIGYWVGSLKWVNPDIETIKSIYGVEEANMPKYTWKDKEDREWPKLKFVFIEGNQKIPIEYEVLISKELATYEKDGVDYQWYVNQHGVCQTVSKTEDLFRSFTHLQTWSKEDNKFVDVPDESGNEQELKWRKCYRGETAIYSLLRRLVTQDWFKADTETDLLIPFDDLLKGNLKAITGWIGTDNYQAVVGALEVRAETGDDGAINYYQNCVDGAWMPHYKLGMANVATQSKTWANYGTKEYSKGKNRDLYEFYGAVKRNKNITELAYIHPFSADSHIAATDKVIQHTDDEEVTMSFDGLQ